MGVSREWSSQEVRLCIDRRLLMENQSGFLLILCIQMMQNCSNCQSHCCGGSPVNPPVVLPYELIKFRPEDLYEDRGVFRLVRENGTCKFLDGKTCSIYDKRPMECRIYPWVFDWDGNQLNFKLHGGCPQKELAPPPLESKNFWDSFRKL